MAELHLKAAVLHVLGKTKDPGIPLFRRLRDQWQKIRVDYDSLVLWNWEEASENVQKFAKDVLEWAEIQIEKQTFPRSDYKELMQLIVISLGGNIAGFTFKLPQNDSNARWMSKVTYSFIFLFYFLYFQRPSTL